MVNGETVMVTGASSGVGRACVRLFAAAGYQVLAGVRQEAQGRALELEDPGRIRFVIVDLQDQTTIETAALRVADQVTGSGLKGLVNCAGHLFSGPLEYFPREQWFPQYDVNLFGTMSLTRSMLALIRKGNGRIINIGAVGGGVALPFFGAIASSKIALQAANDCLRRELHPWGIHVIIIEPGGIDTPANPKMRQNVKGFLNSLESRGHDYYGKSMEAFTRWAYERHTRGLKPEQVAAKALKALKARHPGTRYRVGMDSHGAAFLNWLLPDRVFDRLILWISRLPLGFGAWRDSGPGDKV